MQTWRNLGVLLLSAGLLAAAGCSSDDNGSGGTPLPTNTPTTARTATQTSTVTQTRTSGPATNTPTVAPPTNTPTEAPPSNTPTVTQPVDETSTPTVTSEIEPTETPTVEAEETPTPTPTATTSSGGELGERSIDIFRVGDCTGANAGTNSCFFSSALFGLDVSQTPWVGGPIVLVAGAPNGEGVAQVSLKEDAIFGFKVVDNSGLCVKLVAAGSSGQIDCDGGSPNDVSLVTDSMGAGRGNGTTVLETGLGDPAGPGALTLRVRLLAGLIPAPADPATCPTVVFDDADLSTAFTTNSATARMINTKQGSEATITKNANSSFDCATWSSGSPAARIISPLNVEEQPPINTDVANIMQIQEQ